MQQKGRATEYVAWGFYDIICKMSRKKKIKTELQQLREERIYKIQDFEMPLENEQKRYTRLTHYMLHHDNYKNLSSSAKVLLTYMLDWAFGSDEFARTQTFEYSTTMLSSKGIMSNKTTIKALDELQHFGFIEKENNATKESGITQKWSFSSEWYTGIKKRY